MPNMSLPTHTTTWSTAARPKQTAEGVGLDSVNPINTGSVGVATSGIAADEAPHNSAYLGGRLTRTIRSNPEALGNQIVEDASMGKALADRTVRIASRQSSETEAFLRGPGSGFEIGSVLAVASPDADAKLDRLLTLVDERLNVALEVARVKWNSGKQIEDLGQEKVVIARVVGQADKFGLESEVVETFFASQIKANKCIQTALHSEWRSCDQPSFEKVLDLGQDIRPKLERLSSQMLEALSDALPLLREPGGQRALLEARSRHVGLALPGAGEAIREALEPLQTLSI